ncbi:hypothetical protein JR065_19625 [Xanthomonas sp. AmX2]|uniref:hypothetical protein n=1 Tax=Xanthomonas sp. TaxID=29446 RepID=UPI00197CED14|nr:hypothetical protein [Xanthomonas sp.]MBN6152548.1 hypothetical protein [Xanthomonas sp.]
MKWGRAAEYAKRLKCEKTKGSLRSASQSPNRQGRNILVRGSDVKAGNNLSGKGSYVDPVTGEQRVLIHPQDPCPHCHVNDKYGERLDINGKIVPNESPEAHLPLDNSR